MAKGFDIIQELSEKTGKTSLSASEISKEFVHKGSTSGAATGTIRRACDSGLLIKRDYGIYEVNKNYDNDNNTNNCNIVLKGIVQNAIDSIDRNYSASSLLQLKDEDLKTVKNVLSSLNDIIKIL